MACGDYYGSYSAYGNSPGGASKKLALVNRFVTTGKLLA